VADAFVCVRVNDKQPQGDYIEYWRKKHGYRFDHAERLRKKEARAGKLLAQKAQRLRGMRAKLFHQQRFREKAAMRKKFVIVFLPSCV